MHMVNTNTGLYTVYTGFTNMKRVDMTGIYRLDTHTMYIYTQVYTDKLYISYTVSQAHA